LSLVAAHAVDRACEHRRLVVRRVAGDEDRLIAVLDDDRKVILGVARRRDRDDRAVVGQTPRSSKRPVWTAVENEWLRIERLRPALRQIAAEPPGKSGGAPEFAGADEDFALGERPEAAIVIDMQMGEHDAPDIG